LFLAQEPGLRSLTTVRMVLEALLAGRRRNYLK